MGRCLRTKQGGNTKTTSTFVRDKAVGEAAETAVQIYFNGLSDCHYCKAEGNQKHYDLWCLYHGELIEVKRDGMAERTGNICFEKALFATTKSATVVYVVGDKGYVFELKKLWGALKELASAGKTTVKGGGDRNVNLLLLVKSDDILPFAEVITLGTTNVS